MSYSTPFTLHSTFGLTLLTQKQLKHILLSLYDFISRTRRKKLGYTQDLDKWNQILDHQLPPPINTLHKYYSQLLPSSQ